MPATIRNETPANLKLTGAGGRTLFLSPLEVRQAKEEELNGFDTSAAESAGLIKRWKEEESEAFTKIATAGWGTLVGLFFVCSFVAGLKPPLFLSSFWPQIVWIGGAALFASVVVIVSVKITGVGPVVSAFLAQSFSLIFIVAIGLGLPALTIYFFGEGKALLAHPSSELFVRLLQVGFIGTASLLPVLLFFLFDRYQLSTMRNRLYRDLFRLDRGLTKRSQIDVKYGAQIREAYGAEDQARGRLARGTRSPVLVCAFVMTMGWLAAFKPIGPVDESLTGRPLSPEHSALTFGFLGAYFFGLQLISRRYARNDLKPKAYAYVTIRILIVAVLSWALELIYRPDSKTILLAAFLIGIVPEEFFTLVKETFRGSGRGKLVPESEKHPLTRLEGIDLYDRARLEQEGIVNVESLAHYDLIHLLLETQIPVPRLVDWMDQAILYLHVVQEFEEDEEPNKHSEKKKPIKRPEKAIKLPEGDEKPTTPSNAVKNPTRHQKLREYGIRTATDLLACWEAAKERGEIDDFKKLLGGEGGIHRLELIRDALLDDEWLERVKDWRCDRAPETVPLDAFPHTFEGKLKWAGELERNRHYKEALQILQDAIELQDDAVARVNLARLYAEVPVISLRDLNQSRTHAWRARELGRGNFEMMRDLADLFEKIGDRGDADAATESAIKLLGDPGSDDKKKSELKQLKEKRAAFQKSQPPETPDPAAPI